MRCSSVGSREGVSVDMVAGCRCQAEVLEVKNSSCLGANNQPQEVPGEGYRY